MVKTWDSVACNCRTWLKKLQETEERKNSELKYLRRCGIAIEIDIHESDKQPCLINLAPDPMLSGTLLYLIPPGLVRIGKNSKSGSSSKSLDIMLDGPLVRPLHWLVHGSFAVQWFKRNELIVLVYFIHLCSFLLSPSAFCTFFSFAALWFMIQEYVPPYSPFIILCYVFVANACSLFLFMI